MGVPATLLRKLYVKNSLQNTPTGFRFQLKNRLAPATLRKFGNLTVDGENIPMTSISLLLEGGQYSAKELDGRRSVLFHVNDTLVVDVKGASLAPGIHRLTCDLYVEEVGWLHIPIEDEVHAESVAPRAEFAPA